MAFDGILISRLYEPEVDVPTAGASEDFQSDVAPPPRALCRPSNVSTRSLVLVQAAWRGYMLRRCLPRLIARRVAEDHSIRICHIMSRWPRLQAKVFIRIRNKKIQAIRAQIAESQRFADAAARHRLEAALQSHLLNVRHRLRAAMLLQAWWRGCLARGSGSLWKTRLENEAEASPAHGSFLKNPLSILPSFQDIDTSSLFTWGGPGTEASSSKNPSGADANSTPEWYSGVWEALPTRQALSARLTSVEWAADLPTWESLPKQISWPVELVEEPIPWLPPEQLEKIRRRQRARWTLGLPRKVCIFFSDTGGGHRASAQSLRAALTQQYGDRVIVEIIDFIRVATPFPWNAAPEGYQYVGAFPSIYKRVYESSESVDSWRDTPTYKMIWWSSRSSVLKFLLSKVNRGVDAFISVHPLINHMLVEAMGEIRGDAEPIVPIATVVTDLGGAHLSWFEPGVDLLFVPSDPLRGLALRYGVPEEKIHLCGLPVRQGFWHVDPRPKRQLQEELGLTPSDNREVVLVMGGGEGFGELFTVATAIGEMLVRQRLGQLVVVCGRNEDVQSKLEHHSWPLGPGSRPKILGFVSNVDMLMGAADCLVTKAGPGTIAEGMIKGLPILLTSFIPGQEEGNVTFVTEQGAGLYVSDSEIEVIPDVIEAWLQNPQMIADMSARSRECAKPNAALDIAALIGSHMLGLSEGAVTPSEDKEVHWRYAMHRDMFEVEDDSDLESSHAPVETIQTLVTSAPVKDSGRILSRQEANGFLRSESSSVSSSDAVAGHLLTSNID